MTPTPNVEPQSHDEIVSKYRNILKSNGVTDDVADVVVKDAGLQGEGFVSQALCVTVVFENPKLKNLNLFVKAHTKNPGHSDMISELKAFDKEARFLTKYVHDAQEFLKLKGCEDLLSIYPKCYYGDDELVVLENLVLERGYGLVSKAVMQNLEEAKFAVRSLAKHHAISNAMILNSGGVEKFLEKYPNFDYEAFGQPLLRGMMEPIVENGLNTSIKMLEKHNVEGWKDSLEFLKSYAGKAYDTLLEPLKYEPDEEPLLLLNHGDYWNNNMMFLKNESGETIGHKAIDFQCVRYNSPAVDLAYYCFLSLQPDIRRSHLREILGVYLETLIKISKDLDAPIELTFEDLFLMFRKKFRFGYWFGMCLAGGATASVLNQVDVRQLADISDFGKAIDNLMQKWIEDNPEKSIKMAEEAVNLAREYNELAL